MTRAWYRLLLTTIIALSILWGVAEVITRPQLPPALQVYAERSMINPGSLLLFSLLAVVQLLVFIDLYRFRPWARLAYVVFTVLGGAIALLWSPVVESGWSALVRDAGMFLSGMLVAVMYWSAVSREFTSPRPLPNKG